jgi:hypothetical protein
MPFKYDIFPVFVTSKSYIYLTNDTTATNNNLSKNDNCAEDVQAVEPIYENIDNVNIVPCNDNKFTIYVNYDFINESKNYKNNKSSVRLLEPDLNYSVIGNGTQDQHQENGDDYDNYCKTIQCQQISMYIGENFFFIYLFLDEN